MKVFKFKKIATTLLVLSFMLSIFSETTVKANGIAVENPISKVLTCAYLTEEAKQTIVAMSNGADEITLHIPKGDSTGISVLDSGSDEQAYIIISKTISTKKVDGVNYEDKEETLVALSTLNGSASASGQQYGVAASNVVNITWSYSNPSLSDLKVKFNSMTAKYTYLPTQSAEVIKMEYSVRLEEAMGAVYFKSFSESNPSAGVSYSRTLNSGEYKFGGEKIIAMIKIYYKNGSYSEYEGSPNHP